MIFIIIPLPTACLSNLSKNYIGFLALAIAIWQLFSTVKQKRGWRHNLADNLAKAYEEGGPAQLRWEMNNTIACLQYIILSNRLERYASYEEWVEDIEKLDFGFCRKDLNRLMFRCLKRTKDHQTKKSSARPSPS